LLPISYVCNTPHHTAFFQLYSKVILYDNLKPIIKV